MPEPRKYRYRHTTELWNKPPLPEDLGTIVAWNGVPVCGTNASYCDTLFVAHGYEQGVGETSKLELFCTLNEGGKIPLHVLQTLILRIRRAINSGDYC